MRTRLLLSLFVAVTVAPAARGQTSFPTAADAGGTGGQPTVLAQFQPGINPLGRSFGLLPGGSTQVALYCDSGPRPAGQYFEVVLANTGGGGLNVSLPAGTLLVPRGQPVPEITAGVRRLFAAAQARGLLGTDTLADSVWSTRGFSRADVEQTGMAPLAEGEVRKVQDLLIAADLGYDFARGGTEYSRLYQKRLAELAPRALSVDGIALLPGGRTAAATMWLDQTGEALVNLVARRNAAPLFYAGRVLSRRPDRVEVELLHLKTGRPLQAAPGPVTVKLTATETSPAGEARDR